MSVSAGRMLADCTASCLFDHGVFVVQLLLTVLVIADSCPVQKLLWRRVQRAKHQKQLCADLRVAG